MTKHKFQPGEKEAVAAVLGIEPQMLPDVLELEPELDEEDDEDDDEIEVSAEDEDEDEDDEDDSDIDEELLNEEDDEDDEEDEDSDAEEQELGIRVQAATDDWLANHKDTGVSLADYLKTKGF
jgi:hypothetical protein